MTVNGESGGGGGDSDVLPRCFFDVEIGGIAAGRVVFELFADKCPKTSENFRLLCTGEGGMGTLTGKQLHFKGSVFHRVIKDFMIQGGDFTNFNGTGGESVYGGTFEDENLTLKHDEPFLLSMANRGPNTNGSQFFILTQPAPHLNGVHVVFGRVVNGQPIIKQIEGLPVDRKSRPLSDVRVANCGELVLLKKKKKESKHKKEKKIEEEEEDGEEEKSPGEVSDSDSESDKKKKRKKTLETGTVQDEENQEVLHPLVTLRSIDPDEIPKDPLNRFLTRVKPKEDEDDKEKEKEKTRRSRSKSRSRSRSPSRERKVTTTDRSRFGSARAMDNEGRKIKGRGRICFPRFRSRSRSKTPPHWKAETRRTISMKEYEEREKRKREREEEVKRRQDEREKRHQERGPDHVPEWRRRDRDQEWGGGRDRDRDRGGWGRGGGGGTRWGHDRNRDKDQHTDRSLHDRFKSADNTSEFSTSKEETVTKPKSPEMEQSTKIVDELLQTAAGDDGVVYYQHLYKSSSTTNTSSQPQPEKNSSSTLSQMLESIPQKPQGRSTNNVDEGEDLPPGEDDANVLAELRLRQKILTKRLQDWEQDSDDEEEEGNQKKVETNQVHSAMQAELEALKTRQQASASSLSIQKEKEEAKNNRRSKSKSRSRSKSRDRNRRQSKNRRRHHSSKSKSRSRDRRRSRSRSRSRGRRHRRSRRSRSRSRSRSPSKSRSRSRGHRRR